MSRVLALLGICVISSAVLLACGPDSHRPVLLPTGATPTPAPTPTPNPTPPTPPPQGTYTVSGVVSELISGQTTPLEGVHVEDSQRHEFVTTGSDGSYTISLVGAGAAYFYFAKQGFRPETRQFGLNADMRLDVTLSRQ